MGGARRETYAKVANNLEGRKTGDLADNQLAVFRPKDAQVADVVPTHIGTIGKDKHARPRPVPCFGAEQPKSSQPPSRLFSRERPPRQDHESRGECLGAPGQELCPRGRGLGGQGRDLQAQGRGRRGQGQGRDGDGLGARDGGVACGRPDQARAADSRSPLSRLLLCRGLALLLPCIRLSLACASVSVQKKKVNTFLLHLKQSARAQRGGRGGAT